MTQPHLVEVNRYRFSEETLTEIETNAYAANNWPLVYILSDGTTRCAYVGETTDTPARLGTHLKHPQKKSLTTVHLVSSERFNKSATLDIESSLIKYMSADGCFSMLNGNLGLSDHNYYQRDELYSRIFRETWDRLRQYGIAQRSIEAIDNSDVFKYSPYKSLSADQQQGLIEIMRSLVDPGFKHVVVRVAPEPESRYWRYFYSSLFIPILMNWICANFLRKRKKFGTCCGKSSNHFHTRAWLW